MSIYTSLNPITVFSILGEDHRVSVIEYTTIFKNTIFLDWFGTFRRRLGGIGNFEMSTFAGGVLSAGASAKITVSKSNIGS